MNFWSSSSASSCVGTISEDEFGEEGERRRRQARARGKAKKSASASRFFDDRGKNSNGEPAVSFPRAGGILARRGRSGGGAARGRGAASERRGRARSRVGRLRDGRSRRFARANARDGSCASPFRPETGHRARLTWRAARHARAVEKRAGDAAIGGRALAHRLRLLHLRLLALLPQLLLLLEHFRVHERDGLVLRVGELLHRVVLLVAPILRLRGLGWAR